MTPFLFRTATLVVVASVALPSAAPAQGLLLLKGKKQAQRVQISPPIPPVPPIAVAKTAAAPTVAETRPVAVAEPKGPPIPPLRILRRVAD